MPIIFKLRCIDCRAWLQTMPNDPFAGCRNQWFGIVWIFFLLSNKPFGRPQETEVFAGRRKIPDSLAPNTSTVIVIGDTILGGVKSRFSVFQFIFRFDVNF